jgi:23S rRNA-/tRNA-specific pseudouridylate synthase
MHRFFLHATSVEFPHPVTGKTVRMRQSLTLCLCIQKISLITV